MGSTKGEKKNAEKNEGNERAPLFRSADFIIDTIVGSEWQPLLSALGARTFKKKWRHDYNNNNNYYFHSLFFRFTLVTQSAIYCCQMFLPQINRAEVLASGCGQI